MRPRRLSTRGQESRSACELALAGAFKGAGPDFPQAMLACLEQARPAFTARPQYGGLFFANHEGRQFRSS